jgi:iron complex outermembrane receptor protein
VHEQFEFKPGSTPVLGVAQAADDPSTHATLASSMNLPQHLSLDASLRYVGALHSPALRSYTEVDARLGWRPTDALDVSLAGTNLLHPRHLEVPLGSGGEQITRGVLADVRWKF